MKNVKTVAYWNQRYIPYLTSTSTQFCVDDKCIYIYSSASLRSYASRKSRPDQSPPPSPYGKLHGEHRRGRNQSSDSSIDRTHHRRKSFYDHEESIRPGGRASLPRIQSSYSRRSHKRRGGSSSRRYESRGEPYNHDGVSTMPSSRAGGSRSKDQHRSRSTRRGLHHHIHQPYESTSVYQKRSGPRQSRRSTVVTDESEEEEKSHYRYQDYPGRKTSSHDYYRRRNNRGGSDQESISSFDSEPP